MTTISVNALSKIMAADAHIKVIDVRTPTETQAVKVSGTINIPVADILSRADDLRSDKPVYIFCNSGNRSAMVCEDMALHGLSNLVNVEGGIQAWMKQGLPVIRTKKWAMPMMQQVMAIAGSLTLAGALSSLFIDSNFIYIPMAVGSGLLYAGISGNCYMTKVLALMPWNK
ncbi:MAG: rhodanese-related sulfurtransferase [Candidatus Marinamargulisbacteria bacterium]|jgi:rhodanese-related sulfurtransferase